MHNTIKDLWYNNLTPGERYVRHGSEYLRLMKQRTALCDQLLLTLTAAQREQLEQMQELELRMESISEEELFITSFQLGAQMMADMLHPYHGQFTD